MNHSQKTKDKKRKRKILWISLGGGILLAGTAAVLCGTLIRCNSGNQPPKAIVIDNVDSNGTLDINVSENVSGSRQLTAHDDQSNELNNITWVCHPDDSRFDVSDDGLLTWANTLMFDRHYQFNLTCSDTTGILESSECVVQLDVSKAPDDSASYNLFNVTDTGVLSLKSNVDKSSITKLVVPDSLDGTDITTIGAGAFYYCSSLTSIDLGSATTIGNNAFQYCPLTSIDLGSVTTIGNFAFEGCSSLTSVDLGSVTTISDYAFRDCPSLTSVNLGSVTTIGDYTFQNCSSLNSVTYIAPPILEDTSLVLVDQDGVVQGPGEEMTIDTADDGGGFMAQWRYVKPQDTVADLICSTKLALGRITMPSSVASLGGGAFYYCSSLTSVDLGSVTTIGYDAFTSCSSLTSVDLRSVTTIGGSAFYRCSSLNSVTYTAPANLGYDSLVLVDQDGNVQTGGDTWTISTENNGGCFMTESQYATGATPGLRCDTKLALGRIKMPSSVTNLEYYAFADCPSLTSVNLGSVTTIWNYTFQNCSSLESINLGSVTTIGDGAFSNCSSLNSVTYTAPGTLGDDSLVLVDQDGNIQEAGDTWTISTEDNDGGFMTQWQYVKPQDTISNLRCSGNLALGRITTPTTVVTSLTDYAFQNCPSLTSVNLGSVTTISNSTFYNCWSLESIDLGSVTTIGNFAFEGCSSLTSVDLGSVTTIGGGVFYNCSSLESINLGSVTSIGGSAFRNCPSLTFVDLGSVTTIGDDAFYNCSSLNSVTYTAPGTLGDTSLVLVDQDGDIQGGGDTWTISTENNGGCFMTESQYATGATPGLRCDTKLALGRIKMPISVDSLAASAFQYCPSLTSVDLGSVTTIGNRTFRNCPSLVSVDLGSVTTIGDDAFYNCSSLESINLGSVTSIGGSAFHNCSSLQTINMTTSVSDDIDGWNVYCFPLESTPIWITGSDRLGWFNLLNRKYLDIFNV